MVGIKLISSMEKCLIEKKLSDYNEVKKLRMYRNERGLLQLIAEISADMGNAVFHKIEIEGKLSGFANIRTVEYVPNYISAESKKTAGDLAGEDSGFVNDAKPGLYPDVLMPLTHGNCFPIIREQLHPVYIDFSGFEDVAPGVYPTKIRVLSMTSDEVEAETEIDIEIINAFLPEQETRYTNWFYADCLANYYEVEAFSDRHFEICENYIKTAVANGINMILMPVFTVPLDTGVGHERTTTQLVKVTKNNDKYSFDFSLCERWLSMCDRCGVKYIEVCHLFTQWGSYHAPKVMATVDGEYKKLFGWETEAGGEEYVAFLRAFLSEFTAFLEKRGDKNRTYFHISDEPSDEHIEQYKLNRKNIGDLLEGWKIIEALSHVEFYKQGLCKYPVPISSNIEDFMPEAIEERWVYYCCGPYIKASNRLLIDSLPRTRSIGIQMYKYGIEGFLHWGYNFYNNQYSHDSINPYLNMCAGYWGYSGDALVVYPGPCGMPIESIRLLAIKQGLDDIRVMKLCESYFGKEKVVEEIEKIFENVTFRRCIDDVATMQKIRDRMDDMIIEAVSK